MDKVIRDQAVRVGVDLAKRVIQVHAVDATGRRVVCRALKREQFIAWCATLPAGCLVAMEACSSAHHWARRLRAMGLDARLIAANFVTPYRMEGLGGKNDATDAAAICEAASRPSMRFVPIKSCEQQGVMSLHCVREGLKEERTACVNRIRGVLAEFGLVFGKSPKVLRAVLAEVIEDAGNELSTTARLALQRAFEHWRELDAHLLWCDHHVGQHVRSTPAAQRAAKIIASASSARRHSPPAWVTSSSSRTVRSLAPGWASCRARIPAAARFAWGASPSAATTICARCSSRVRRLR
jgi:transposase